MNSLEYRIPEICIGVKEFNIFQGNAFWGKGPDGKCNVMPHSKKIFYNPLFFERAFAWRKVYTHEQSQRRVDVLRMLLMVQECTERINTQYTGYKPDEIRIIQDANDYAQENYIGKGTFANSIIDAHFEVLSTEITDANGMGIFSILEDRSKIDFVFEVQVPEFPSVYFSEKGVPTISSNDLRLYREIIAGGDHWV